MTDDRYTDAPGLDEIPERHAVLLRSFAGRPRKFRKTIVKLEDEAYALYKKNPEEVLTFLGRIDFARDNGLEYPLWPDNPNVKTCILNTREAELRRAVIEENRRQLQQRIELRRKGQI